MTIVNDELEKKRHTIILYCVRVEDLLRKNGATGKGFKALVNSIHSKLDVAIRRNIERMGELRNQATHVEFFECSERDMANFEAQYKSVTHALINMLDTKKQNEELVNNLKVTMAASTGIKKCAIGLGIGVLVIGLGFGFVAKLKR